MNAIKFVDILLELGVKEAVGVPCSYLGELIKEFKSRGIYTEMCNEGDCIAYAAGCEMSGRKCVVLMQNSGITNALSPLSSLIYPYEIPIKMIIGNRGNVKLRDNTTIKDEPQHEIMQELEYDILNRLGIPNTSAEYINFDSDFKNSILEKNSYAIMINKGFFDKTPNDSKATENSGYLSTEDQIKIIVEELDDDDIVVASTGYNSRILYKLFPERKNNFYMVGSMGLATSIAAGFANSNPDRKVVVIDGDGSLLMRPDSYLSVLSMYNFDKLRNLEIIVIDNGSYESTGGQKLPIDLDDVQYTMGTFDNFVTIIKSSGTKFKSSELPRIDNFGERSRFLYDFKVK